MVRRVKRETLEDPDDGQKYEVVYVLDDRSITIHVNGAILKHSFPAGQRLAEVAVDA